MKKRLLPLLLTALLVVLSACGQPEKPSSSADAQPPTELPAESAGQTDSVVPTESAKQTGSAEQTGSAVPQKTDTPKDKEVLISELYSEDGHATDSTGTEYDYSYHVPQIEDDTPDAANINGKIRSIYGDMAEFGMDCVKSKEIPSNFSVTYESYRSGTVLSLLIQFISYYDYAETYDVYHYDVEKGIQLTNSDLLAMQGITEAQYLHAVRRAAAACYDTMYFTGNGVSDRANDLGAYNERRGWTLSSENITPDLMTYLDNDGAFHAVVPIGAFAGGSWTYHLLPLDPQASTAALATTYSDFLSATLQDNELSIQITRTDHMLDERFYSGLEKEPPCDTAIPVHGAYSDYVDMAFFEVPNASWPILFLLTSDGRVEYVSIGVGLAAGYSCVCGPMPHLNGIVSLEKGADKDGNATVYALLEDGERVDLSTLMLLEGSSMSDRFHADWTTYVTHLTDGGSYEAFYSLLLTGCDNVTLQASVFDADLTTFYTGYFYYLGMAEDGVVYCYNLWSDETSEWNCGAVAMRNAYVRSEDMDQNTLFLKELSGDGIIDTEPGETTAFVESFG